jgi:RHS repeat-associated protein
MRTRMQHVTVDGASGDPAGGAVSNRARPSWFSRRGILLMLALCATTLCRMHPVQADPPPPTDWFPPEEGMGTCWFNGLQSGIPCYQVPILTLPFPTWTLGQTFQMTVTAPASGPCGGVITYTGAALYTDSPYDPDGFYIPGAVTSSAFPTTIPLQSGASMTITVTLTSQGLPPAGAGGGNNYWLFLLGTLPEACTGPLETGLSELAYWRFFVANPLPASNFFLVKPTPVVPQLGPCDGSASKAGCAKTPEPIDPSSGNEAYGEPDDYSTGDGRLKLTRTYNSTIASAPSMPNQLGLGWQHNFMGRQITTTNNVAGLLPQYSVSHNYSSAQAACEQGWLDVAPGQPNSTGVTATYSSGVCQLSNGQSWPVYTSASASTNSGLPTAVTVQRPGGAVYLYSCQSGACTGNPSVALTLVPTSSGYTLTDENDTVEQYDTNGNLLSITTRGGYGQTVTSSKGLIQTVTDSFGRSLAFAYTSNGQLQTVTTPSGQIQYGYDTSSRLASVTFADGTTRSYSYTNTAFPNALTGVTDESGNPYAAISYDGAGRAYQSNLGGIAWQTSVDYTNPSAPVLTDAFNVARTYQFTTVQGRQKASGISGSACNTCNMPPVITYDTAGYYSTQTDWNGNVTQFTYDDTRGLPDLVTEAFGTPRARSISTQWDPLYRQPDLISLYAGSSATGTAVRTVSFTYDTVGNVLTRTSTDTTVTPSVARTWTYTYNNFGQVLTMDGPRTDVSDITTYTYYTCATGNQCGQLETLTNALGQVTTFNTYNPAGQPTTITDPNNVVTTLTYDARQRLSSWQIGGETTALVYWPTGELKEAILPDGSYLMYTYDAANRLTQITDGLGNKVLYTIDAMGNRTAENDYDPSNALVRTHTRIFNTLNQLWKDIGAAATAGVTSVFAYDNNGNRTSITDPLGRVTAMGYDELNRLSQNTDAANGVTQFTFDVNDNVSSVLDPRNITTTYSYGGLAQLNSQSSPDTGGTANTYDSAGNLATSTDARGAVSYFTYDALNRPIARSYASAPLGSGGTVDDAITFAYDSTLAPNGIGRPFSAGDNVVGLQWNYDARGRVIKKTQSFAGGIANNVEYAYTNADLTTLTTPSGQVIAFSYNNHQVTNITVNGSALLSQVTYTPFGSVAGWQWASGLTTSRAYDTDGRVESITSAGQTAYSYNGDGTLETVTTDAPAVVSTLATAATMTPSAGSNRITSATGGLSRSYTYDAAGHVLSDGTNTFTYNNAGRLVAATNAGITTTYTYNAAGQRVRKVNPGGTVYFVYDEPGHLIGEYDGNGNLIEEIIWLRDIPVASIRPGQSGGVGVFYIHTDQQNAPTRLTRANDNVVIWRWDHDAYGNGAPMEDPDGNGANVTFNLRFPGQYFDSETGLLYNYFRDYDSLVGRYVESDPIGLYSGLNTYAYAGGDPMVLIDPLGLYCYSAQEINGIAGSAGGALAAGAALIEFGPAGVFVGVLVGGVIGGVTGYFSTDTLGNQVGTGAVDGGISSSGLSLSGALGGAAGGAVTYGAKQLGASDTVSEPLGSAVGGAAGDAAKAAIGDAVQGVAGSAAEGGAIGLAAGATRVAVAAALRAGNNCPCGNP